MNELNWSIPFQTERPKRALVGSMVVVAEGVCRDATRNRWAGTPPRKKGYDWFEG